MKEIEKIKLLNGFLDILFQKTNLVKYFFIYILNETTVNNMIGKYIQKEKNSILE